MNKSSFYTWFVVFLTWFACTLPVASLHAEDPKSPQVLHAPWTDLLRRHVTPEGFVDYEGFLEEEDQLDAYLQTIRKTPPAATWSAADKEAYWINVYNAATIYTVLQYFPVASMNEIRVKELKGYKSAWEAGTVNVGGKVYSLNAIEKEILRPEFKDPRVHFALVSAATSCPPLLNEAYDGARLNQQLDAQGRLFLSRTTLNQIAPTTARLSSLFDWYAAEFGEGEKLVAFLNRYSAVKIEPTATVEFLPFDWSLNNRAHGTDTQALRQR
ncbi:DUF547 domain-containing protein [Hymenobacter chitinivorans]|uniref:Uncharacterized protein DUF547 n=1 Tax=Hymenobacter chitinivorans DSM 11115 TaxID=1121954 RepID=A0A2M9BMN4_9BACT|nr:DUF547 domain-containing protein [Hymenobacter chitinivorans]PJJ59170.1 uncharacterized protein DUF547 [Hymenobacter chitinivorans DSM 11115]